MVHSALRKPLGFVLMVTAHLVCSDSRPADVTTGVLGKNVTLRFTFNTSITSKSRFGVYKSKEMKVSEYPNFQNHFEILSANSSILYYMTNLCLNDSDTYHAMLFVDPTPIKSNRVKLRVKEWSERPSTDSPLKNTFTTAQRNGSTVLSTRAVAVLVVSHVGLLVVLLLVLIICLIKTKRQKPEESQRNSLPTLQEVVDMSCNVAENHVVYSTLDFPKRPPSAVEVQLGDTEYATISCIT